LLCPPKNAYALTQVWPDCRLQIMENAGHCMSEPGVAKAMAEAVRALARK
jgi:proline iminopeptidase